MLDFIVMQMSKGNREKGYWPDELAEVSLPDLHAFH